jgi:hypothetical protein
MGLVDQLLGQKPLVREDTPALWARPQRPTPARREPPQDEEEEKLRKKAACQRSVVASIMGMTESDDESIIPDDAEQVDTLTGGEHIPGIRSDPLPSPEGPSEPGATTNVSGEELIQPTAALVAPDITPNAMRPIDPSQVPAAPQRPMPPPSVAAAQAQGAEEAAGGARGVMDLLMGRQNSAPQPEGAMAESMVAAMTHPAVVKQRVAEALVPGEAGGTMPRHQEGDGQSVFRAFRQFV